ncbi:MAG: restriction endonuclease subunit S [Phenylobacterium sp.]|uniref:restriction endonuclease subunit S n=1 Tax=Phenylobacterium sp. TaxID=1871053 RepID=UPI0026008A1D|nr:restriction endonuclease subunit S [Phenylobacterium sp.]MCG9915539.1 restriction endonuclease subunit S [Phenylobacterium sp.]
MSELPSGWIGVRLGELGNWFGGGTPSKSNASFWAGDLPWVSPKDMKRAFIDDTQDKITLAAVQSSATSLIPARSVLIVTRSGILRHSLPVAVNTREVAISQDLKALVVAPFAEPEFVAWQLQSCAQSILASCAKSGTTVDSVDFDLLRAFTLSLPPLAEQRRIVAKLDALTARTARARADLDRIPALAARYKQAVLRMAFSGELTADWRTEQIALEPVSPRGELDIRVKYRLGGADADFAPPYSVPESWRWLRLPELGDMDRGKSRHRPRDDARLFGGPFPFVQTGEVRAADRYLTSYSKTYSEFGLEQSRLWPAGTVCITIAANIAETAILGIDACFPDSVVGFSADSNRCQPDYVEYFIRTAKADLEQFAPATAQKNINLEVLGSVRLPVAPLDEQAEIIRRIDRAFTEISRMTAEAAAARRLLDRLDQAVLAKAFRGELVPQDPTDEPASILLDRIRAERAAAPKAKRGRVAAR